MPITSKKFCLMGHQCSWSAVSIARGEQRKCYGLGSSWRERLSGAWLVQQGYKNEEPAAMQRKKD
jgi:hypothetical protein